MGFASDKQASTTKVKVIIMIPKIKTFLPMDEYMLKVTFDDGKTVLYDVKDDIKSIPSYGDLLNVYGLFNQAHLDESRTVISWTDEIDLPSDSIYEFGTPV